MLSQDDPGRISGSQPGVATVAMPAAAPPAERIAPNFNWLFAFPDGAFLKGVIILFGIIAMSCAAVFALCINEGARGWFLFVSATAWVTTLLFSACYFMNLNNRFTSLPWLWIEVVFNGTWAVLYLIAAIVEIAAFGCDVYIAAAVFGFILTILYGYCAYSAYRKVRAP